MNSALAGLFRGVQGSASAYGKQKEDQRAYELDEKKAQQAAMRQEHFAKYNYGFQDSGMRGKDGRVVNNNQYAAGGEFESALSQKAKITEQARVDAEGRASEKKATLLTEKEAKDALKLEEQRKYTKKEQLEKEGRADKRLTKKQKQAEIAISDKDKKSLKNKFTTSLTTELRGVGAKDPARTQIILSLAADGFGNQQVIKDLTQVKKARWISKNAFYAAQLQQSGVSKEEIIDSLVTKNKMSPDDALEAHTYAVWTGTFADSEWYNIFDWGLKGKGN